MSSLKKEFQELYNAIKQSHYILIVTHINPDADTLSSALALGNYLSRKKINHKIYNSSKILPQNLDILPRFNKIINSVPQMYDLLIYVDCGDKKRVGFDFQNSCKIVNIDHHHSNDSFGSINIVDSSKASTAELIYDFFKVNNIEITKEIATCLYVGIYDDSIAFTTPRTNSKTFDIISTLVATKIDISQISQNILMRDSLAKYRLLPKILESLQLHLEGAIATIYQEKKWLEVTGAGLNECDDVVNEILKISIVKIAIYLRDDGSKIRVSLRGKSNSNINLSKIAASFNGGGHQNAAGLTMSGASIQEVKDILLDTFKNYI